MLWTATLSFIVLLLMTLISEICRSTTGWWTHSAHNKLKLNDDKTEALIISARRVSNYVSLPNSLIVGNSTVRFSQSARYLGVTLDMHLTMTAHVVSLIWTANFKLRRIDSIRYYLSVQATKTLVSALFFHDWTIAIPSFPDALGIFLNRLQKVKNNAVRLILKAPKIS